MFRLYRWYILSGQLIHKKVCELRNNQTSLGLREIEGVILSSTKIVWSDYYKVAPYLVIEC